MSVLAVTVRWRWLALVSIAYAASGYVFLCLILPDWFYYRTYLGDFSIFWLAGSAARPYDDFRHLPLVYPPTALFLFRPFGLMSFWWALGAWTVAGFTGLCLAAKRLVGNEALIFGLLTASCMWLALAGQISWFVAPLVITGLTSRRPWLAGLCFAAAGVVKPQAVLALPFVLLASKNYRVIGWTVVFASVLIALSIAVFGFDQWVRWLGVLERFRALLLERGTDRMDVGLYGLTVRLGLPGWPWIFGVPLALASVWRVFSGGGPDDERYAAFACASVLMSPYTLGYDLAALSIVSASFLLDKGRPWPLLLASALIVSSVLTAPGIVLMSIELARRTAARGCSSVAFPKSIA